MVQVDDVQEGRADGYGAMEDAFRSACASTFSGLVLDAVCSERTTVNRSLDRPVSEIPVVLFSVLSLHMNQFMHLIVRNINVLIKSWLTGENQLNRKYTNLLREKHVRVVSRAPRSALLRSEHKVANLPDGDDSDEEAEEDDGEDGSVCSDDGGLEWDDMPSTTSSTEAEKNRRRKEEADRKFIHRTLCHLMRADPGDEESFMNVALPAAYH